MLSCKLIETGLEDGDYNNSFLVFYLWNTGLKMRFLKSVRFLGFLTGFIWESGDIYNRLSRILTARGSSTSRKAWGPIRV